MFAFRYPAIFEPELKGKGFVVKFPDIPEALTGGKDLPESLEEASDCLGTALACRIIDRREVPPPSRPKRGQRLIDVPLWLAPKLALYLSMREQKVSNSELARRLGCRETVVRRMLDPKHDSRPEKLQAALEVLGKRLVVALDDAA